MKNRILLQAIPLSKKIHSFRVDHLISVIRESLKEKGSGFLVGSVAVYFFFRTSTATATATTTMIANAIPTPIMVIV